MDLTKHHPRSMHDTLGGVAGVARLFDKACAKARGVIGDYTLDRPMDFAVYEFLGTEPAQFLAAAARSATDAAFEPIVAQWIAGKSDDDIRRFNAAFVRTGPAPGSGLEAEFSAMRAEVAPGRTDVTAWADLIDLDEGRAVPSRLK